MCVCVRVFLCVCVCVCVSVQVNLHIIINDNHWYFIDGQCWSVNESVAKSVIRATWILCALQKDGAREKAGGEGQEGRGDKIAN